MIALLIVALVSVMTLTGWAVRLAFGPVRFMLYPCGRGTPRWLRLLLVATLLGALVFLQHNHRP